MSSNTFANNGTRIHMKRSGSVEIEVDDSSKMKVKTGRQAADYSPSVLW